MAKADETGSREAQKHVSMQASNFPKDLVQRFMNGNDQFADQEQSEEPEEIELSLGLSLNGRFGVDPTRANNKLTRSSSIPDFINPFVRDRNETSFMVAHMACANLIRTRSLPTETEEEWGKRKELQTLRRMEAKRKRSEKQRNVKIAKDRSWVSGEDDKWEEGDNGVNQMNNCGAIGVKSWVYGGAKAACCNVLKSGSVVEGGLLPPASQASIGSSLGSGSSGISDLESQPPQGSNKCTEAVSPLSVQSIPKNEDKPPRNPEVATAKKSGKSTKTPALETRVKMVRNVLEDMPCVTTTGDGPNGKRIEGFLYRYTKDEEVMIVCVCHGSFLSPAEFVKHAGGGDVAHPLKHIVVNPYPIF